MSVFRWGDAALDTELKTVQEFLAGEVRRAEGFIREDIRQALCCEGKLLRPALVILAGRLGIKKNTNLISLAAAVEMIHLASLIHDDIIDGAVFRRGAPALHVSIGAVRAVLSGDWLLARALSIVGDYYTRPLFVFLTARIEELCRSEILQDASGGKLRVSRAEYFRRIDGKTVALLRLACRSGAEINGADQDTLKKLDMWALSVGRAFQMDDDALDYLGQSEKLGKGISVDLRSGLATMPLIIACETNDRVIARLTEPLSAPRWFRRWRIRRRVAFLGAAEAARKEAQAMYNQALAHAAKLPESGAKNFTMLTKKLKERGR